MVILVLFEKWPPKEQKVAFNDIVVEFEQLRSDCACHLHNSQHNSYLLMVEVSPELVDSKSTHRSVNRLLIAGNVSILLLTRSLPLYYKMITVIALTNNNMRENKTKLDRSEQHAANFYCYFVSCVCK